MTSSLQPLSAPELILSLADSAREPRLEVARLVAAGRLLGIDAGAVRVAAARLVKKGILTQASRGVYRIGGAGHRLHRRVLDWHRVESQVRHWDGRWLAVYSAHLPRSQKSRTRARERALRLRGFAAFKPGLAVRPANLRLSATELRGELMDLGLDDEALLLGLDADDPRRPLDARRLWDLSGLEASYRHNLSCLEKSRSRVPALDVEAAARETLLVGRAVMRDIVTDPLLPETLVDTALRRRMILAMVDDDRLGKAAWRAFYASLEN
jgi:phenylacetic acid degradation operon negative regulatory protein